MAPSRLLVLAAVALAAPCRASGPATPRADASAKHFDAVIAPLLSRHCLECHNASDAKGGLDLSTQAEAFAGGESGKAIVAGRPDESLLWGYVESNEMPKDRPALSAAEKTLLKDWIAGGAAWGTPTIDPFLTTTDRRAGYDWWSLRPIADAPPPAVKDAAWPRNEVDAFVLARLEAAGLRPSPEADRRTLLRRLSFDLVGLPPTPEEVEAFVIDPDPLAYEKAVDRLLASPRYGERWARHWLDVVRFGESQGFERNRIRENAWRYRDWTIAAFNADLPFGEFVRLQIAGDALRPGDADALVATGYHVCGTWDQVGHLEGSIEMRKAARQDHLEDLVAALGQSFLGLTVQCARCHDHKVDPIPQRDYYRFAALLAGVHQKEKEREKVASLAAAHVPHFETPPPTFRLDRGDHRKPKEVVAPAGLAAVSAVPDDLGLAADAPEADRRRALAGWLADPRNPLPARVWVNRVWHHHFGVGIVDTPSDFGFNGGRPSHPELLDRLAARFLIAGGRTKELHRLIVTSATYRQGSTIVDFGLRIADSTSNPQSEIINPQSLDADNRLLWRGPLRRLEGEAVRDAMLAVGGVLNAKIGGPSVRDVKVDLGRNHAFTDPTNEFGPVVNRRTVYRLWARSGGTPLLESFDCPEPSVASPRRTQTITPIQALSLFNGPFAERCAASFADRVRRETSADPEAQADRAYRLALSRPPRDEERRLGREFITKHGLEPFCLVLLNTNEFVYVN